MWRLSAHDLRNGAREKCVASNDFSGPLKRSRRVTDIGALVCLFLGWCVAIASIIVPAITADVDFTKVLDGVNYKDETCDGKRFYPLTRNGIGVCVDKCPTKDKSALTSPNEADDTSLMICIDDNSKDIAKYSLADGSESIADMTPNTAYKFGLCNYQYRTIDIGHRCVFRDAFIAKQFDFELPSSPLVLFAQSYVSSPFTLLIFAMAVPLLFAYLYMRAMYWPVAMPTITGGHPLNYTVHRIVWLAIWVSTLAMLLMASHLWYRSERYSEYPHDPRTPMEGAALKGMAVFFWLFATVWIFTMIRARHAITLSVMLTIESHRPLVDIGTGSILMLSFFHYLICGVAILISGWGIVNLCTMDSGYKKEDSVTGFDGYIWGNRNYPLSTGVSLVIGLITLWTCQFFADVTSMTVSLSVCEWFFTRDKARYESTLMRDYGRVFYHHWGTAAIGALIHTFTDGPYRAMQTIEKVVTSKLSSSSRSVGSTEKNCAGCCVKIMDYTTLWCTERCLKYLSSNAYSHTVMFGYSYFHAARSSFYLMIRNVHRVGATVTVAQLIPTIGKVSVTMTSVAIYYFIRTIFFTDETISMFCGVLVAIMVAWISAAQLLAPMTQASTTLLHAFMLDEEMFMHSREERYASKELHTWVDTFGGEFTPHYELEM